MYASDDLADGTYVLIAGDQRLVVRLETNGHTRTARHEKLERRRLTEGQLEGHVVEVSAEMWAAFASGNDDTACLRALTGGDEPLAVCSCDVRDHEDCVGSSASSDHIPRVLQGMTVPRATEAFSLSSPSRASLREVIHGLLAYQFREYFLDPADIHALDLRPLVID